MKKGIDFFLNKQFGRLTVLSFVYKKDYHNYFKCLCSCGKITTVRDYHLEKDITKSCGCGIKKHGKRQSKIYNVWNLMLQRCSNPKCTQYKYYGALGIKVCESWHTFENFYKDMGDPPPKHTLDRIDGNKNYYKENCRWVIAQIQNINRHKRKITKSKYKGVSLDSGKWRARITNNRQVLNLGHFGTEIEAATAYNKKAIELWGSLAILNTIE